MNLFKFEMYLLRFAASVGQYAVQMASNLGFTVISTASPSNHATVKSLGASHVFNYNDPDVTDQIRAVAPDLEYVFDTIGSPDSSVIASNAVKESGGKLCTVRPGLVHTERCRKGVEVSDVLVWTLFLKDHAYKEFKYPVSRRSSHSQLAKLSSALPLACEVQFARPRIPDDEGLTMFVTLLGFSRG